MTDKENDMKDVVNSISNLGVMYKLKICKPSFKTKLSFAELGIPDISNVATPSAMRLIDQVKVKPFTTIGGRMRTYLLDNSHEGIGGLRFVPWNKFKEVKSFMDTLIEEWDEQLKLFSDEYDENLEESVKEWRDAALLIWESSEDIKKNLSSDNYVLMIDNKVRGRWPSKSELKDRFKVVQTCAQFSNEIGGFGDPSMIAEAQELANAEIKGFIKEAMSSLRKKTVQLCSHVKGVMQTTGTIKEQSLEPLRKWVKQFEELNFLDDVQCKNFLDDLNMFLGSGSSFSMQEDYEYKSNFEELLDSAAQMATDIADEAVESQLSLLAGNKTRKLSFA